MACGARRSASAIGIAERTPNGRTSYEAASTTPRRDAPADDDGLAAQRGVVALLDGRVEGVHVDVEDGLHGSSIMPRPPACYAAAP